MKLEQLKNKDDTDTENQPYALSIEQEAELIKAIEETYHEENLISHDEALIELAQWLPKSNP